jgi:hypothetical protein
MFRCYPSGRIDDGADVIDGAGFVRAGHPTRADRFTLSVLDWFARVDWSNRHRQILLVVGQKVFHLLAWVKFLFLPAIK